MRCRLLLLTAMASAAMAGASCKGSFWCPMAGFFRSSRMGVAQGLRDAMYSSPMPNNVTYDSGDHVICVSSTMPLSLNGGGGVSGGPAHAETSLSISGFFGEGGICILVENTKEPISLAQVKPLVDKILVQGCNTCGQIPTHFFSDKSKNETLGVLKIDYVPSPVCVGNCISSVNEAILGIHSGQSPQSSPIVTSQTPPRPQFTPILQFNPNLPFTPGPQFTPVPQYMPVPQHKPFMRIWKA